MALTWGRAAWTKLTLPNCVRGSKPSLKTGNDPKPTFMTKTRRGDVVLVLFPNSDLRTAKRRPALVIQRNNLDNGLPQTIVAMISSNLARRGHPSRVFVGLNSAAGKTAGLRLDSVIMTDNLATVLDSEMDAVLGKLPEMRAVDVALKHTLELAWVTTAA